MADTNTLYAALAKLQAKPINAKQTGLNPHFKSNYSTLEDCWEAARKPLADAGLVVTQAVTYVEGQTFMTTSLTHAESGEGTIGALPIVGATDMQKLGSAITYARRYGLVTMVGILTGEEDGDGEIASTPSTPTTASEPESTQPSDAQVKFVNTLLSQRQVPSEAHTAISNKLIDHEFTKQSIKAVIDRLQEYPAK